MRQAQAKELQTHLLELQPGDPENKPGEEKPDPLDGDENTSRWGLMLDAPLFNELSFGFSCFIGFFGVCTGIDWFVGVDVEPGDEVEEEGRAGIGFATIKCN